MKIKALAISLTAVMVTGCTGLFTKPQTPVAIETQQRLTGIWAMLPLRNGIANVVKFDADAKATIHAFNCLETEEHSKQEVNDFRVSNDGKFIHLRSPKKRSKNLKILLLDPQAMRLGTTIDDQDLIFEYLKVDKVIPLCTLYPDLAGARVREAARKTPFKASDFIQNHKIPAHPDMQQYVGKWTPDKTTSGIEIVMDSSGSAYLYNAPDENWKYLFNDVHWVGDELHSRMFAYSDRPNLYGHPFHKFQHELVLKPGTNGKLIALLFVNGKQYDEIVLSRKDSQD